MPARIRSIETRVPDTVLPQDAVRDMFRAQPGTSRLAQRIIGAAFDGSSIDTRHTVISELGGAAGSGDPVFYGAEDGLIRNPGTGVRNDVYAREAPALLIESARAALEASGFAAEDVTHVITVSCTGFFAPGPDYVLVRALGLGTDTQRYNLGFMGCYGAFPALRSAAQFCAADPGSVVLVVCLELCTLHIRSSDDPDSIVAASVFADGAAAAVVSAREDGAAGPSLELDAFSTAITSHGEADMAWTISDHGFEMVLSSYVPHIIGEAITGALAPVLSTVAGAVDDPSGTVDHWAIHPGGRSILDRVESTMGLTEAQLVPSREVLRTFGNMSSGTVLFILRRILHGDDVVGDDRDGDGSRVCAMAFGPGLTVESAMMTRRALRP
ncbi:putative naringenin-chalcone synthase [Labedella gwakjiensis]|uniref:Putative naringenin-chalcone synthase n=1 Tax=Labedella gwakjiensis TaxID=390269 RepID=A0A2P8GT24_9MICO|nr:type III polyketide synthase [Labedella gwakjiensis]PSL37119.1 putative naringenin-chalcone synthase [Labedella gwakjiensis]RUQ81978.1 type III polyketide synthase [Labedella gwakjiensis]